MGKGRQAAEYIHANTVNMATCSALMLVTHLDEEVDYSHPIASVKEQHILCHTIGRVITLHYSAMSGRWFAVLEDTQQRTAK